MTRLKTFLLPLLISIIAFLGTMNIAQADSPGYGPGGGKSAGPWPLWQAQAPEPPPFLERLKDVLRFDDFKYDHLPRLKQSLVELDVTKISIISIAMVAIVTISLLALFNIRHKQ